MKLHGENTTLAPLQSGGVAFLQRSVLCVCDQFCVAARLPSATILPYRARSLSISLANSGGPIGASSAPSSETRFASAGSD